MWKTEFRARCVHSPLTTCTHDRSKNRGKGVVFITRPRKFNVREIKKKRVFWSTVSAKQKNRVFFPEPTTIYASKNSTFSGWFFSFSVGFPSDLALFCSQNSSSQNLECGMWSMGYSDNGYQQFVTTNTSLAD